MKDLPAPVIKKEGDFFIVRDDLFPGGTKRRALERMIDRIEEDELVYACDYWGHAAYAIALTVQDTNKKVSLFYPGPQQDTDVFKKVTTLPHVTYIILDEASSQIEAVPFAEKYAESHNAYFFPMGLDFEEFRKELIEVVKGAEIEKAPEIWVLGASGNLARALHVAYPHTPIKVVNQGAPNGNFADMEVYDAPEELYADAEINPPYPSASVYDAKVWRFVQQHAKPGAYVWNVA